MSTVRNLIARSKNLDDRADALTDAEYEDQRAALDRSIAAAEPQSMADVSLLLDFAAGYLKGGTSPHVVRIIERCRDTSARLMA